VSFDTFAAGPAAWWLAAAVLLGIGEILIPGVFLVFLAIAAAITGIASLALADLPLAGQLVSFAVWSGVAVAIGRRWYRDYPVDSSDPLLNDRIARLIGQDVVVIEAIDGDGIGRVRVGDSVWSARGPAAAVGQRMRVVGGADGVLLVEAIDSALPGAV
jgi:membrane protein implicated in regulation of membrane protease activity